MHQIIPSLESVKKALPEINQIELFNTSGGFKVVYTGYLQRDKKEAIKLIRMPKEEEYGSMISDERKELVDEKKKDYKRNKLIEKL